MKKHQRGIGKIESPNSVDPLSTKMRTFSYSFGVSRSAMKKLHVDEILKKKDENLPGPDRYERSPNFGKDARTTSYTMGQKLNHFDQKLTKEKKLPGPGYYMAADLVGKGLSVSNMKSSTMSTFPKSTDRFRPPKQQSPPATTYNVKDAINENFNSQRTYMGSTRFGSNKKNFIDTQWHLDRSKGQPGPGQYTAFSDFTGAM